MEKNCTIFFDEYGKLLDFAAALSSPIRMRIMKELAANAMSVKEIALKLNIPMSTASANVKMLEEADLVRTSYQAGKHGSIKLCAIKYEKVFVEFTKSPESQRMEPLYRRYAHRANSSIWVSVPPAAWWTNINLSAKTTTCVPFTIPTECARSCSGSTTGISNIASREISNISILKIFSFLSSAARKRPVTGTNFLPTSLSGSTTSRSAIGAVPGISAA